MPPLSELPNGPRREFVEEMFFYFRTAGRPTLREIDDAIRKYDLVGTASRETIRRVLQGTSVPSRWTTVEAILYGLCDLAGFKVHSDRWPDEMDSASCYDYVKRLWNDALDSDPNPPKIVDPWDQEPPF
ncbi:hypothetical protein [Catellatospora sp. TT07R-123]|uniref:hypothetical protein n=1 Tax=Catellatospora sp. TT07R-123 TaxID=2733863 RepID=UPI001BB4428D|nr:hypothetical protein [Catellatospora sp. TT07R-123]